MAACTPSPTLTVLTTSVFTTISISTSTSDEVNTITSTVFVPSTSCVLFGTASGAGSTCVSSTVISSPSLSTITTTTPHATPITVPVYDTQTRAVQTLWSSCPDQPNPPTPSPTPDPGTVSSTTGEGSTVFVTRVSTYTDSNGIHTTGTTITSSSGTLNPGDDNNKSGLPLPTIIGGVVGGVIGLIAIIALVWYLLWRREQTRYLFDDDEDDGQGGNGVHATGLLARDAGRRGRTRSVNLDDEIKGADAHPYQYGLVGGTPSPQGSPAFHSQNSTMGYGTHQRSSSRDALMPGGAASPSISPRHLDVLLPTGQRRASQLTGSSSGAPESIMMMNQQPMGYAANQNLGNRVSDERDAQPWMGHHPRPSSSLLEAPAVYPPGHGGFYQQYGPIDHAQPVPQAPPVAGGSGVHKPPLDPALAGSTRPLPAHQALYYAAGLSDPNSPQSASTTAPPSHTQSQGFTSPPPGAGGARQYPVAANISGPIPSPAQNRESDLFSAVMASADHASASAPTDVGFGRQRRSGEKSPTPSSGPRSPVIQHRDGGRVLPSAGQAGSDAPPPAYSDP